MYFLAEPPVNYDDILKAIGHSYKEIEEMSDADYALLEQQSDILNTIFNQNITSSHPVSLYYYTFRKDLPHAQLTCTTVTPSSFVYYTMSQREASVFQRNLPLHRHNFYELTYVIDGELYQNIETSRHLYPKGSFCLMNKNIRHREEYSEYSRILFLQLSDDFISSVLNFPAVFPTTDPVIQKIKNFFGQIHKNDMDGSKSYIDFIPADEASLAIGELYTYFEKISSCLISKDMTSSFEIAQLLMQILFQLFNENYFSTTPVNIGTEKQRELFSALTRYIDSHMGRVSRRDLEEVFHYSGDYLYQIIEKYTGHSIASYCMQISMQYAAKYLSQTNASVQDICLMLGFSNRTQFYREFKKAYGMTPKAFRQNSPAY